MTDSNFKKLENLDADTLDFIFSEANKKLQSVNKCSDILDKKSFTIISILLIIMGLVVPITAKDFSHTTHLVPYVVLVAGFGVSLFFLIKTIWTTKYYGDSFKPSEIISADEIYLESADKIKSGFLIQWYDGAIIRNVNANTERGKNINIAINWASFSLILFIVFYGLLRLI